MQDKLKCYEEALATDPGSRLFFPLAKLYLDNEQIEKAEKVLKTGLERYPEHLEARLLLANIYFLRGQEEEGEKICVDMFSFLKKNMFFWSVLERFFSREGDVDFALVFRFLASRAKGEKLTWGDVLNAGLLALESTEGLERKQDKDFDLKQTGDQGPGKELFAAQDVAADTTGDIGIGVNKELVEPFDDIEDVKELNFEQETRTRSLADLLFEQEEYAKALDIYEELLQKDISDAERNELEKRVKEIKDILALETKSREGAFAEETDEDEYEKSFDEQSSQVEIIDFLSKLAERLEARAGIV